MKLTRNLLETALRLSTACSKDETRLNLCGVHIFKRDDVITLEAIDGYILAREVLPGDDSDLGENDLILCRKDLSKLKKFLKDYKGRSDFEATITDHGITVNVGPDIVSIYRINREFPRVDMVIPKERDTEFTLAFNPEYLLNLFESLKVNKNDCNIELSFDPNKLLAPMSVRVINGKDSLNPNQTGVIMGVKTVNAGFKGQLVVKKEKKAKSSEVA